MAIPTMIIGDSGAGKSASIRNLDKEQTILFQSVTKPLPFKSDWQQWDSESKSGQIVQCDKLLDGKNSVAPVMVQLIKKAVECGKKIIIIDDMQYIMSTEFMNRAMERGFDKFTEIAKNLYDVVIAAQCLPDDVRVYFLTHSEDVDGRVKAKTLGKLIDDKVTLEGMFTLVMRAGVIDGEHKFSTQNSGSDTVKTPMGMFEQKYIPNDLAIVDETICNYYNLTN